MLGFAIAVAAALLIPLLVTFRLVEYQDAVRVSSDTEDDGIFGPLVWRSLPPAVFSFISQRDQRIHFRCAAGRKVTGQ